MSINWYNLSVVNDAGSSELKERRNVRGRYGHRRDIEPIIRRYQKCNKESAKLLTQSIGELKSIRKLVANSNDPSALKRCDALLTRLTSIEQLQ
jgi:hypothetical protein